MKKSPDTELLFLHALPLNGEMWRDQMTLLPNQTHAPNLYEYGDNIEAWAKNSLALTKSKKLIVVGCSVGGSCALQVAKLAPERIAALVLVGTNAHHNHNPSPKFYMQYVQFVKNNGVQAAWKHYWLPLIEQDDNKEAVLHAENIALNQSSEHLTNGLTAFHTRPNLLNIVTKANFPIHVVMGEHDTLPGLSYCQDLAKAAKHGSLHIISSCGHYAPMTNPEEFNTLLSDIINTYAKPQFI